MAITFQDVCEAVEQLEQAGETPTITRIRETLGHRGSLTTISKYFKEYKSQTNNKATTAPLPDPVSRAVAQVWQHVHEEALEKIKQLEAQQAAEKAQWEEEKNTHQSQYNALQETHDTTQHALEEARMALNQETAENKALNEIIIEKKQEIERLQSTLNTAQKEHQATQEQLKEQSTFFKQQQDNYWSKLYEQLKAQFTENQQHHTALIQYWQEHQKQQAQSIETAQKQHCQVIEAMRDQLHHQTKEMTQLRAQLFALKEKKKLNGRAGTHQKETPLIFQCPPKKSIYKKAHVKDWLDKTQWLKLRD